MPDCLLDAGACPAGTMCDPANGQCVDPDGGPVGSSSGGSSGSSGGSNGGGPVGTSGDDGGSNADAPTSQDHGCGCRAAGEDRGPTGLGLTAAAMLGLGFVARRRRR